MNEQIMVLFISIALYGCFVLGMHFHARRRVEEIRGDPRPSLVRTRKNRTLRLPRAHILMLERAARDLEIAPDDPPLKIGDECLFLGELIVNRIDCLTVVDGNQTHVVVSWDGGSQEEKFPRVILRRIKEGSAKKAKQPNPYELA